MLLGDKPFTLDRIFRYVLGLALITALVLLMQYLQDVLLPFVMALILAYLVNPLVTLIQQRTFLKKRILAVAASLVLVTLVVGGLASLVIPSIASEAAQSGRMISNAVQNTAVADRLSQMLPEDIWRFVREVVKDPDVQDFLKAGGVVEMAKNALKRLLPGMWQVVAGTTQFLLGIVGLSVIVLYLVFLLIDYDRLSRHWKEFLPKPYRRPIADFVDDFKTEMHRYFRGQFIIVAIVATMFSTGFWLIGLPFGIVFGIFVGLLNMVPYLQLIAIPPALFLGLIQAAQTGQSVWVIFGLVALVFAVVQTIQDGFLTPKILGDITGLSPAVILLSLSVWGKILGLMGLLIAIPVTCLILAYYRRYLDYTNEFPAHPPPAPEKGE